MEMFRTKAPIINIREDFLLSDLFLLYLVFGGFSSTFNRVAMLRLLTQLKIETVVNLDGCHIKLGIEKQIG